MEDDKLTITEAQKKTDILIQQFGGYWPPLSMLASITEEVGELAREINHLEKHKIKKPSRQNQSHLGEELADTLFSLLCVANHYKVDMAGEFIDVLTKYRTRDKNRYTSTNIDTNEEKE